MCDINGMSVSLSQTLTSNFYKLSHHPTLRKPQNGNTQQHTGRTDTFLENFVFKTFALIISGYQGKFK